MNWRIYHRVETVSTNLDARRGYPGDVFTADFQSAGRGRLDHKWLSTPGTNLMMSVVLSVTDLAPEQVATLPLAVGLAVVRGVSLFLDRPLALKWPNDVLCGGLKLAGILCERKEDRVIAGIGVNVRDQDFPPEIASKATSIGGSVSVTAVRDAVLAALEEVYRVWRDRGLSAFAAELDTVDFLRGKALAVRQTDDDAEPVRGLCGGICRDGALDVGGRKVYAGEAHVESYL